MSRVLVTGGAGNIGSYITDQCIEKGHNVIVVDNLYNGKKKNIQKHIDSGKVKFIKADIADYDLLINIFEKHKPEYVSHQASLMILDSEKIPHEAIDTNIKGTFNIVQACIESQVKKITFASSASVFGDPRYVPVDESHPHDNRTLYGATKIACEALFNSWAYKNNLAFTGFRYFNTYSERQGKGALYTQVFQKWIINIKEDKPITIYGDGEQTMDLIHSEDVARANMLALFNKNIDSQIYNVGTGIETSLNELKEMLFSEMKKEVPVIRVPQDKHLVRRRQASTKKIKEDLGFVPSVSLTEGIRRYINAA